MSCSPSGSVYREDFSGIGVKPPVEPMLAMLVDELPTGDYLYEPKWDGFRAIVFRGEDAVFVQSRDSRPLDRYFPELHQALRRFAGVEFSPMLTEARVILPGVQALLGFLSSWLPR
ncbi:MAG: ATP-dependent ligase [Gammaproteobacteria bacterium]|nr:ATP-dependent ligase [Gammaproteobacteria bacterium]